MVFLLQSIITLGVIKTLAVHYDKYEEHTASISAAGRSTELLRSESVKRKEIRKSYQDEHLPHANITNEVNPIDSEGAEHEYGIDSKPDEDSYRSERLADPGIKERQNDQEVDDADTPPRKENDEEKRSVRGEGKSDSHGQTDPSIDTEPDEDGRRSGRLAAPRREEKQNGQEVDDVEPTWRSRWRLADPSIEKKQNDNEVDENEERENEEEKRRERDEDERDSHGQTGSRSSSRSDHHGPPHDDSSHDAASKQDQMPSGDSHEKELREATEISSPSDHHQHGSNDAASQADRMSSGDSHEEKHRPASVTGTQPDEDGHRSESSADPRIEEKQNDQEEGHRSRRFVDPHVDEKQNDQEVDDADIPPRNNNDGVSEKPPEENKRSASVTPFDPSKPISTKNRPSNLPYRPLPVFKDCDPPKRPDFGPSPDGPVLDNLSMHFQVALEQTCAQRILRCAFNGHKDFAFIAMAWSNVLKGAPATQLAGFKKGLAEGLKALKEKRHFGGHAARDTMCPNDFESQRSRYLGKLSKAYKDHMRGYQLTGKTVFQTFQKHKFSDLAVSLCDQLGPDNEGKNADFLANIVDNYANHDS